MNWNGGGLVIALLLLSGCGEAQLPFLLVQSCLGDARGVADFKEKISSIARERELRLIDNSEGRGRARDGVEPIGLALVGPGEMHIMVTNLAFSPFEVLIGFNQVYADEQEARELADYILGVLEEDWEFEEVPQGLGALPLTDCP